MSLENKTIIVTGAASGIGAATAKQLKDQGATVVAFDINEPTENVDEYHAIDLANMDAIAESVKSYNGQADVLCNIAGVPPSAPTNVQLDVNFFGLRKFTELILPSLSDGAAIINLASVVGSNYMQRLDLIKKGMAYQQAQDIDPNFLSENNVDGMYAYAFSKELLLVWTMKMVSQLKDRNITIKALSPGPVKTPILQDFMDTIVKKAPSPPTGFEGEPDVIASLVCFLCGSGAQWINGQHLIADGGLKATRMSAGLGL